MGDRDDPSTTNNMSCVFNIISNSWWTYNRLLIRIKRITGHGLTILSQMQHTTSVFLPERIIVKSLSSHIAFESILERYCLMRKQDEHKYIIELRPRSILINNVAHYHRGVWTVIASKVPFKRAPWDRWVSGIPGYDGQFDA